MKVKPYSCVLIYIFLFVLIACAKQSSPTGGPKDTIPPVVINVIPANKSIQYHGKTFELTFNEFVQLKNAREEIIINPSIGKDYEVVAKKTKVILTTPTELKDSTTYTINFREAVTDITERNPAKNLRLAISTGPYIDSLSIEGIVTTILDQKVAQEITVGVQPYIDTFSILKHTPTYFTKTDKQGKYKVENLKPGLYSVYAIRDANRNLVADTKSEVYAFLKDSILLDENKKEIDLSLVKQDLRQLKITSGRPYNTYFNIKTSRNIDTYSIVPADGKTEIFHTFGADRQNVLVYNTIPPGDSLLVNISVTDSTKNSADSSMYLKFREGTPEKFTSMLQEGRLTPHNKKLQFEITFSKPLKEINFDSLSFEVDSLNTLAIEAKDITYDEPTRILKVNKAIPPGLYTKPPDAEDSNVATKPQAKKWNNIRIGKGAIVSIENDSSQLMTQALNEQWESDLGVIMAEAKAADNKVILQLVNQKLEVIQSIHGNKATFSDLVPSEYLLRIIIDKNGNGEWDAGNYLKREEPEPIIYYETEKHERSIKLKANFEIGPLLITY
jgi:uncharacterized protein (DUF2141 family)